MYSVSRVQRTKILKLSDIMPIGIHENLPLNDFIFALNNKIVSIFLEKGIDDYFGAEPKLYYDYTENKIIVTYYDDAEPNSYYRTSPYDYVEDKHNRDEQNYAARIAEMKLIDEKHKAKEEADRAIKDQLLKQRDKEINVIKEELYSATKVVSEIENKLDELICKPLQ